MTQPKIALPAALLAAIALTACGSAAQPAPATTTPVEALASTPTAPVKPASISASPTSAPVTELGPALTETPTATTPNPPTAQKISAALADRLEVIRESSGDFAGTAFAMKLSPDGRLLAMGGCGHGENGACSNETILRLIDVDTGRTLFDLKPLVPVIEKLAFSPDSATLAIAGCVEGLYLVGQSDTNCHAPRLWTVDTATGSLLHEFGQYISNVTSIVWSPDGSRLYTGVVYETRLDKVDNEISYYDTASGKKLGIIEPLVTNCSIMRLDMSPNGHFLVLDNSGDCGYPSFVEWWDLTDPARPRSVHHESPASDHHFSPDGKHIMTLNGNDNTFKLFDLQTGDAVAGYPSIAAQFGFGTWEFLGPDRLLLSGGSEPLQVYDLTSHKFVQPIRPSYESSGQHLLSPDGGTLMTYGYIGKDTLVKSSMSLWDVQTQKETILTTYAGQDPYGFDGSLQAFSADQTRLVMANGFARIVVWGIRPPEQDAALKALADYLGLLAQGAYAQAAKQLVLVQTPDMQTIIYNLDTLPQLVPEADPADSTSLLKALCTDPRFPCMTLKDVAYQAQVAEHTYLFVVSFTGPDGNTAVWPLCTHVPATKSCSRRDGLFEYYVQLQPDGSYGVVNGLPPSLELRNP